MKVLQYYQRVYFHTSCGDSHVLHYTKNRFFFSLHVLSSAGDRSQVGSADRQDSDGDDSDGPDDEENDDNEEEEEDSQAESGLSTNPSVSASPQHIPSKEAEVPPSALLAQMSISSVSLTLSQPPAPESQTSHLESIPMMGPVSLSKQISISGSCYSPMPLLYSPPPVATTSDSYTSDTESVHMMSPVSPCRQMSIDYPDFDVPPSPPVPGKGSKLGQVRPMYSHCVSLHASLPASLLSYPYPYFESCMRGTSTKLL